jgi:hypothetical protein
LRDAAPAFTQGEDAALGRRVQELDEVRDGKRLERAFEFVLDAG